VSIGSLVAAYESTTFTCQSVVAERIRAFVFGHDVVYRRLPQRECGSGIAVAAEHRRSVKQRLQLLVVVFIAVCATKQARNKRLLSKGKGGPIIEAIGMGFFENNSKK
jgi:hypothetical protein